MEAGSNLGGYDGKGEEELGLRRAVFEDEVSSISLRIPLLSASLLAKSRWKKGKSMV